MVDPNRELMFHVTVGSFKPLVKYGDDMFETETYCVILIGEDGVPLVPIYAPTEEKLREIVEKLADNDIDTTIQNDQDSDTFTDKCAKAAIYVLETKMDEIMIGAELEELKDTLLDETIDKMADLGEQN